MPCAPYSTPSYRPTDDRRVDSARTRFDVRRNIRTATIRINVGNNVLVVPGHEVIDGLAGQAQIGGICIHLAVLKKRTLQIPVDKVVIELQHAHLGILQNEEPHVYGQGVTFFLFIAISYASSNRRSMGWGCTRRPGRRASPRVRVPGTISGAAWRAISCRRGNCPRACAAESS